MGKTSRLRVLLSALLALTAAASCRAAQDLADAKPRGAEIVVFSGAAPTKEDAGEKPPKPPTPPAEQPKAAGQSADTKESVDPTIPRGKLKEAYEEKAAPAPPPPAPPKLPDLTLRGLIKAGANPASAIIDIDNKKLVTVQTNSQVSVKTSDGRVVTLKVTQVSSEGVEIEVPELKEKLSLR